MSGCIGRRGSRPKPEPAPKHGDLVKVPWLGTISGTRTRRWCGFCKIWTWECWGGTFRHRKGTRTRECVEAGKGKR